MDSWDKQSWKQALDSRGSEVEEEAYRRLGMYLFPNAMKLIYSEEMSREFVQQTLVKVFESYPNFRWNCHIKTYATSIMKNQINQYFRKAATRKEYLVDFQEASSDEENINFLSLWVVTQVQSHQNLPDDLIEREELRQVIIKGLDSLSNLQKTALVEYAINQKSAKEVADLLGISITALYKNVSRARKLIKKYVKSFGF